MKKSLYSIVMVLCVNTPEMNAQHGLLTILDNDAFKVESDGRLQISTNSTFGTGQIKLIENQYDYARITFSNNIHTNDYWDVAVRVDTNLSNSLFHFQFQKRG